MEGGTPGQGEARWDQPFANRGEEGRSEEEDAVGRQVSSRARSSVFSGSVRSLPRASAHKIQKGFLLADAVRRVSPARALGVENSEAAAPLSALCRSPPLQVQPPPSPQVRLRKNGRVRTCRPCADAANRQLPYGAGGSAVGAHPLLQLVLIVASSYFPPPAAAPPSRSSPSRESPPGRSPSPPSSRPRFAWMSSSRSTSRWPRTSARLTPLPRTPVSRPRPSRGEPVALSPVSPVLVARERTVRDRCVFLFPSSLCCLLALIPALAVLHLSRPLSATCAVVVACSPRPRSGASGT